MNLPGVSNPSSSSTSTSTNLLRKRMEMASDPDASFLASSSFGGHSRSRSQSSANALAYSPTDVVGYSSYASASGFGLGARPSWSHSHLHLDDVNPLLSGIKRPSQALYHQNVLDAQRAIGQSEAWYSTNLLSKRPRLESASNLPIYPQRPGQKDCAHYMLTRTCKFGLNCKFDHPIWVPEGGIPDWKEAPLVTTVESPPQRAGEPDCPYFLKTQTCKFGLRCKFNHPRDKIIPLGTSDDTSTLPERPTEPPCAFYLKTGNCKFGATCKFHHPKDIKVTQVIQDTIVGELRDSVVENGRMVRDVKLVKPLISLSPASSHNTKGLPIRPGEVDCPFYLKTGSCKYGATCRYNHPERNATDLHVGIVPIVGASPASNPNFAARSAASIYQAVDPRLSQLMLGVGPTIYPQRPGQIECDYYMKTGACKFEERCKFHHPIDRSASTQAMANQSQQTVELTLAGLPRRKDAIVCPYYLKTGTCKYGATCKFDHPPPGELIAMAATQGQSATEGEEAKEM
ncbi:hypothetical protein NL676_028526 [Syzygium grande]|nr:hypothetical protein NL676_028526 [Syzygium grande]